MSPTPARRVAIVTGSESGIGRAVAVALARAGCDVGVVWFESEDAGRETVRAVEAAGGRAALEWLDLLRPGRPAQVVDVLAAALGGLDVLVNCAGTHALAPALSATEEDVRRVIDVNLVGAFLTSQAAARHMVAAGRGGRIVNITSVNAVGVLRNGAAYTASKHGLAGLTKAFALELAEHGITVNAVAPGAIAVPRSGFAEHPAPEAIARADIPVGRLGLPEEVARAVVHLAAPEAGYTTGATLVVDGGMLRTRAEPAPPTPRPLHRRVAARLRRRKGTRS